METDIFDFDKTIVPFDSGSQFTYYCMRHYPWCIVTLPITAAALILVFLRVIDFTKFKKVCFLFVTMIPLKKAVKSFWDKREKEVFPWVYEKKRRRTVISASPDFLLEDICERIGVDELICSVHSLKTGALKGENCKDDEKVRRFRELHGEDEMKVIDVYSDSLTHDRPIFSLSTNMCYHIVDGERVPFRYGEKFGK